MSVTPENIMQLGMGFWASKALLTAVDLDVFSELARKPQDASNLAQTLGLHERSSRDFFDSLVALGVLGREGNGSGEVYTNTAESALFLDKSSPAYVGGMLEMANERLYHYWGSLREGLETGQPQSEIKDTQTSFFETVYEDPEQLAGFLNAMEGISTGPFLALADAFDFSCYGTICDVGGGNGALAVILARRYPHLRVQSLDLPVVQPIAAANIEAKGMTDRVEAATGDMFRDPLPAADVITMGNILHDWNLGEKKQLIAAAYASLPDGGALIAIENIIDDARCENAFGLLMSLNMLIETHGGFDFSGADFAGWVKEAGFRKVEVIPLAGPVSAAVAYK
jgi:hypothetical protein